MWCGKDHEQYILPTHPQRAEEQSAGVAFRVPESQFDGTSIVDLRSIQPRPRALGDGLSHERTNGNCYPAPSSP
jgi:hypothetical protein